MAKLRTFPCVRMTPAGIVTVEFRMEGRELECWEEYNRRHRPDSALVVGEEIRSIGAFPDASSVATLFRDKGVQTWAKVRV